MKRQLKLVFESWRSMLRLLFQHPRVFAPFLIIGILNIVLLYILYLFPRPPFSIVFAPVIRTFWGEKFLHYPYNFLILPRIFDYTKSVFYVFAGGFFAGLSIQFIKNAYQNIERGLLLDIVRVVRAYLVLFFIWLTLFILSVITFKFLPDLLGKFSIFPERAIFYLSLFFNLLVYTFFAYSPVLAVLNRRGFFSSLKGSFIFAGKNFLASFLLVMVPAIFYVLFLFIKGNLPYLRAKFFPEVTLIILVIGVIFSVIIDFVITSSVTLLFLKEEEKETLI